MHRKGMIHSNGMFFLVDATKGTCIQVGSSFGKATKLRRKYR